MKKKKKKPAARLFILTLNQPKRNILNPALLSIQVNNCSMKHYALRSPILLMEKTERGSKLEFFESSGH